MKEHQDRAKQFVPYAALRGFDAVVAEKRILKEERRELSEDECVRISEALSRLEKGDYVRIVYYFADRYVTRRGRLGEIDKVFRRMTLEGEPISFDDILDISEDGFDSI